MSFFKVDTSLYEEDKFDPYKLTKPKYTIDKDGNGRWIYPIPPLPTDYCEDIDY